LLGPVLDGLRRPLDGEALTSFSLRSVHSVPPPALQLRWSWLAVPRSRCALARRAGRWGRASWSIEPGLSDGYHLHPDGGEASCISRSCSTATRRVLLWRLSITMEAAVCVATLEDRNFSEARNSSVRHFEFYSGRRPHSSLEGSTPEQAYFNSLPLRLAA
jgi:hypothetical protein